MNLRTKALRLRRVMRGLTLTELMIVVVIVGVLAAVAYPNYREFAARAKRNEARAALLQVATNQEKFYLQNQVFTEDMTELGFGTDPYTTDSGSYSVDVNPGADSNNFTATATYQLTGSEEGKCKTFTINGAGVKGSGPDTNCWARTR